MIITTCGFGNTGSSAILDFLKGYLKLQVVNMEFKIIHMPDGILDLKYSLVKKRDRITCNAAILRFLKLKNSIFARRMNEQGCEFQRCSEKFISELAPMSWKGFSAYDPYDLSLARHTGLLGIVQKSAAYLAKNFKFNLFSKERFFGFYDSFSFDSSAKTYIKNLLCGMDLDLSRDIVLDQLVSASDPFAGTEFIDEHKIIVVYRDPIDLFIRANTHQSTNGYFPCADVKQFVEYYKMMMKYSVKYDKALYMQYEDLIYNYYPATQKIMDFLGYKERPENEFKYFNPDISVKYTRADIKYPGYDKEIAYIKQNLSEYLYSFPERYSPVSEQKKNCGA